MNNKTWWIKISIEEKKRILITGKGWQITLLYTLHASIIQALPMSTITHKPSGLVLHASQVHITSDIQRKSAKPDKNTVCLWVHQG